MGCYDPTESQLQIFINKAAKLFVGVLIKLKEDDLITDDLELTASREGYGLLSIDEHSQIPSQLCAYVKQKLSEDKDAFEAFMYNGRDRLARDLASWWEDHCARDALRSDTTG